MSGVWGRAAHVGAASPFAERRGRRFLRPHAALALAFSFVVKPWCHPPLFLSSDHGGRPLLDRRITALERLVRTRRQDDLSVRDVKKKARVLLGFEKW